MEEYVALDSTNQKKFVKSIKGIKKLLKKNDQKENKSEVKNKNEWVKNKKQFSMRLKDGKISKKPRIQRGLVYLGHIPHGFYEHQMTEYFKQFGAVTNARVIRSKTTGNSKGHAFVEFKEPTVAQVVAETMNNYLMGKRLIKAAYIPPEKIRRYAFRKKWNPVHNPTSIRRMKFNKEFNADKDEGQNLKKAKRLLTNLNKTKKKLQELGINYDFFTPVDVPSVLLDSLIKQEKEENAVKEVESNPKKHKKNKNAQKDEITKVIKNDKQTIVKEINKDNQTNIRQEKEESNPKKRKNEKKLQKDEITKVIKNGKQMILKETNKDNQSKNTNKQVQLNKKKKELKKEIISKGNKKDKKPVIINKKEQKIKAQQLKAAGVKSVEEFISIGEEDSDESCEFDSDEYERMLEDDDDD